MPIARLKAAKVSRFGSDGLGTARPCSDDPKQSDGKDRNEGSRSIDQGGQPVCHVQVEAAATPDRSSGLGDKQGQTVERVRHACQAFGCLIGEQASRWRLDLQGDQPVDPRLADSMQTSRVRGPGHRVWLVLQGYQPSRKALQNGPRLCPGLVIGQPDKMIGDRTPARESGEQTVHRFLQHRRVIANLRRFADRLVDGGIEGNDTADEVAPNGLRIGLAGPCCLQCSSELGHDSGGKACEQRGQLTAGVAAIGPGENNAGGDDADADLGDAANGERESLSVQAAGGTKLIAGNDHGRIPGQGGRVRRVVLQ
jgi:hypothetical protein